jgi:uncharacterized cysteine cluster protein YcgN (CxxCxxCC family)
LAPALSRYRQFLKCPDVHRKVKIISASYVAIEYFCVASITCAYPEEENAYRIISWHFLISGNRATAKLKMSAERAFKKLPLHT